MTLAWKPTGTCAALLAALALSAFALAGPAAAKSYSKKQCSHQIYTGTATGYGSATKAHAIDDWRGKVTGQLGSAFANPYKATQKHLNCTRAAPKQQSCTFSARPCGTKKTFIPTDQPPKVWPTPPGGFSFHGFGIGIGIGRGIGGGRHHGGGRRLRRGPRRRQAR